MATASKLLAYLRLPKLLTFKLSDSAESTLVLDADDDDTGACTSLDSGTSLTLGKYCMITMPPDDLRGSERLDTLFLPAAPNRRSHICICQLCIIQLLLPKDCQYSIHYHSILSTPENSNLKKLKLKL